MTMRIRPIPFTTQETAAERAERQFIEKLATYGPASIHSVRALHQWAELNASATHTSQPDWQAVAVKGI